MSNFKPLLVLDFDETLIHSTEKKLNKNPDIFIPDYFVYLRPNLKFFLDKITKHYQIAIWSTATIDYLKLIIKQSYLKNYNFEFVWDRRFCDERYDKKDPHWFYIKKLSKVKDLGFNLNRSIIVDDSFEKIKFHYKNAILFKPYMGNDDTDNELIKLYKFLFLIKDEQNFRKLGLQHTKF